MKGCGRSASGTGSYGPPIFLMTIKRGVKIGVKSEKITPFSEILEAFSTLKKDDLIFHTQRVRFLDNKPVCVLDHYIPLKYLPKISENDFTEDGPMQSIHNVIEKKHKIQILKWIDTISAIKASPDIEKILKLTKNSPILLRKSITFSTEGLILYYSTYKFISQYEVAGIVIFKER